ncbi:unnamed protein product [Somion occarium]|uniref:F-box domain-containing protein n=1 Tax=Somion occarium TaxID=3059160 RepID=A0ABP1CSK4_9APHY
MDIPVVSPSRFIFPSHISRLPPELLAKIFLHLADAFRHEPKAMGCFGHRPYAWLRVTRVCHFWHDAALGCPPLWAFINTSYPVDRIKMLLRRSGQVPLISVLALVLQEVPRIMKLEVMITESFSTKLAMTNIQYPSLRSLCLRSAFINFETDTRREKMDFALNFDIPRLRSLKAFSFEFSEAKTLFRPWLQKLILQPASYPPLHEVSECIRGLPLLSSLDLLAFNYFNDSSSDYPKGYKAVALNHLQWLHIDGNRYYCRFLDNLEIAPGACVSLELSTGNVFRDLEDIDTMTYNAMRFCGLPNHDVVLPQSRMLRSMAVQYEVHHSQATIDIQGWDVVFSRDIFMRETGYPHSLPRPFIHLKLRCFSVNDGVVVLSHFCRNFNVGEIQALILGFAVQRHSDNDAMWHGLAHVFDSPSIETLVMLDWHAGQLASLITTDHCNSLPSGTPSIPFPGLKTLVSYRLRWADVDEGISPSPLPLTTGLQYRAKNNVGIETLCLRDCISDVNKEDLEESMAVVPNLMWNVKEPEATDDDSDWWSSVDSASSLLGQEE